MAGELRALLEAVDDARSSPANGIDIAVIKKLAAAVREAMGRELPFTELASVYMTPLGKGAWGVESAGLRAVERRVKAEMMGGEE